MPRSGSTLLQNILGNNPDIYATPTSAVFDYLNSSKKIYSKSPIIKAQDEKEMKDAFLTYCRYAIHGYFDALTDKPYVIDKSRAWGVNKSFLESFYPNPKVICIVRDLRDILASMEKNYRNHPDKLSTPENEGVTVGERVTIWMSIKSKPVGQTLHHLAELFHRGFQKNMLFIRFEDLTNYPQQVMDKVHEYLEIDKYKYDFNNIKQVTFEDDKFHGIYGNHKIQTSIRPVPSISNEFLGSEICEQLYENNKWYFEYFNYEK